jgi:chlorite dismutase
MSASATAVLAMAYGTPASLDDVEPYYAHIRRGRRPPPELLAEHGRMGHEHPEVLANTVSAFAVGDYEWLLAFEADDLVPIVDLMRHLRAAEARRHTRAELPFLTGRRRPLAEAVACLP